MPWHHQLQATGGANQLCLFRQQQELQMRRLLIVMWHLCTGTSGIMQHRGKKGRPERTRGEMELLVRWWHNWWHTRWHTWWQLTEGCVCRKDPFLSPARAAAREIPTTFPNPTLFDNITKQHISPLEAGSALTLVSI